MKKLSDQERREEGMAASEVSCLASALPAKCPILNKLGVKRVCVCVCEE